MSSFLLLVMAFAAGWFWGEVASDRRARRRAHANHRMQQAKYLRNLTRVTYGLDGLEEDA